MVYLAKKVDGKEAKAIGLVNECVDVGAAENRALDLAGEIAKQGPVAIRMAKRAIDEGYQVQYVYARTYVLYGVLFVILERCTCACIYDAFAF
jgi:methylglutaconyl-CoA hydratase